MLLVHGGAAGTMQRSFASLRMTALGATPAATLDYCGSGGGVVSVNIFPGGGTGATT